MYTVSYTYDTVTSAAWYPRTGRPYRSFPSHTNAVDFDTSGAKLRFHFTPATRTSTSTRFAPPPGNTAPVNGISIVRAALRPHTRSLW